jgi:hypothetical protein
VVQAVSEILTVASLVLSVVALVCALITVRYNRQTRAIYAEIKRLRGY